MFFDIACSFQIPEAIHTLAYVSDIYRKPIDVQISDVAGVDGVVDKVPTLRLTGILLGLQEFHFGGPAVLQSIGGLVGDYHIC